MNGLGGSQEVRLRDDFITDRSGDARGGAEEDREYDPHLKL
jgi:hypothetical protein